MLSVSGVTARVYAYKHRAGNFLILVREDGMIVAQPLYKGEKVEQVLARLRVEVDRPTRAIKLGKRIVHYV